MHAGPMWLFTRYLLFQAPICTILQSHGFNNF